MKVQKTIKFPIHSKATKIKIEKLGRLTARMTFATNLFLDYIQVHDTTSLHDLNEYKNEFVKERTGMNSAHLQQCYMKAREVWKSYKKLKRRKSLPEFKNRKVPIYQDRRTFEFIEWKGSKLTRYWIKITTLKPRKKIIIPLDYGYYQIKELENVTIKSVTFVKKGKRFFAHVSTEKNVKPIQTQKILAVDLGVRRKATAVLLSPSEKWSKKDICILKNGKMKALIHKHEKYYKKMQKLEKYEVLKRIRNKKETYKKDHDRIISKRIAEIAEKYKAMVMIGYPKWIRLSQKRGSGDKQLRKKVNSWSFYRTVGYIEYKCKERGIPVETIKESWTSKTCHRCGSKNINRNIWSIIKCKDCGLEYNADINACINIGSKAMPSGSMGFRGQTRTEGDNQMVRTQKFPIDGNSSHLQRTEYIQVNF